MLQVKRAAMVWVLACMLAVSHTAWGQEVIKLRLLIDGKMQDYIEKEIHLVVDNKPLTGLDMPPISLDGRTYVPVRAIGDAIGAQIAWQPDLQEIYITRNNTIVVFEIDNAKASKNGEPFIMDVPAKVINDRTLVPLRGLADALDCQTAWDDATRTAYISTGAEVAAKTETETATTPEPPAVPLPTSGRNRVTDVKLSTYGGVDEITVEQNVAIVPTAFRLTEPDRIVLDFANTENGLLTQPSAEGLSVITDIRTGQQEDQSFRIVLEAAPSAGCAVTLTGSLLHIVINETGGDITLPTPPAAEQGGAGANGTGTGSTGGTGTSSTGASGIPTGTTKNMTYDLSKQVLRLKKGSPMELGSIHHEDDYWNGKYILTLPGNFESDYGQGQLPVNDGIINHIAVQTVGGVTTITFDENRIRAIWISEDENYYYLNVKDPKAVYPKIVVLDAGHGGSDPGTNGNGIIEKDMALIIAQKVFQKLEANNDVKVYFTRPADTYPPLQWRAQLANDVGDIFVSVHLNTADLENEKRPLPNGTETLYNDHATDVAGAPLTSKSLAAILQKNMVASLGLSNRGVQYRDDLLVLNATTAPAAIVEVGFLSNPGDALKISQETGQELAAQGIYNGIIEALE